MRIVDISGPIEDNMWSYGDPYPAARIEQIPPPTWLDYPVYSQTVSFAVQSGTYLETAAHLDRSRISIDQVPLERCYLLDAVALWIPKEANGGISLADLLAAQEAQGVHVRPGDALLVGTGWDKQWYAPNYVTEPPYFTADAMAWVLEQNLALLGGDTPRFDSPHHPQNFLPQFFQTEMLMLAPVVNMDQIQQPRGKLTALPLKIKDACASPVRALWLEE